MDKWKIASILVIIVLLAFAILQTFVVFKLSRDVGLESIKADLERNIEEEIIKDACKICDFNQNRTDIMVLPQRLGIVKIDKSVVGSVEVFIRNSKNESKYFFINVSPINSTQACYSGGYKIDYPKRGILIPPGQKVAMMIFIIPEKNLGPCTFEVYISTGNEEIPTSPEFYGSANFTAYLYVF